LEAFLLKQVQEEFAFFESLMKGLTAIFGTNCEVVLHDLTDSYESTVVMIENGHVTDRRVGDCGSNLGLEVLRGTVRNGDKYGYFTNTRDGRVLRSSSVYIRDGEGKVIGCLCVNLEISRNWQIRFPDLVMRKAPFWSRYFTTLILSSLVM